MLNRRSIRPRSQAASSPGLFPKKKVREKPWGRSWFPGSFIAPVEGLYCKPKYRANIIHHFSFVLFIYFPITLPVVTIEFTVAILNFGIEDFTDPSLFKIRLTSLVCRFDILFLQFTSVSFIFPGPEERKEEEHWKQGLEMANCHII